MIVQTNQQLGRVEIYIMARVASTLGGEWVNAPQKHPRLYKDRWVLSIHDFHNTSPDMCVDIDEMIVLDLRRRIRQQWKR